MKRKIKLWPTKGVRTREQNKKICNLILVASLLISMYVAKLIFAVDRWFK